MLFPFAFIMVHNLGNKTFLPGLNMYILFVYFKQPTFRAHCKTAKEPPSQSAVIVISMPINNNRENLRKKHI